MFRSRVLPLVTAAIAVTCLACGVQAGEPSPSAKADKQQKPMKMDEPMTTEMMKPGMKKGDVKDASEKKARTMQPMMEQEQKSMPPEKAKP